MAWLFGSSKKSNKPEVYVSNETEDGFNVVSARNPYPERTQMGSGYAAPPYPVSGMGGTSPGQYSSSGPGQYSSSGPGQYSSSGPGYPLYPNLPTPTSFPGHPYLAICPQAPPGHKPPPVHPLDSVPFKLSSGLDLMTKATSRRILSELESIRTGLDNVSKKMKSSDYNYSFDLERSVLREERMAAAVK